MRHHASIVLALFSHLTLAAVPVDMQPQDIHAAIQKRGAKAVVNEIYENHENWSVLLNAVSSGNPEWLKVAKALSVGTDAGSANMLQIAVTRALGNAPRETLKLMSEGTGNTVPVFWPVFVCSSNFLIDYPADKSALEFIDNTIEKLNKIKEPGLIKIRDECVKALHNARLDTPRIMREQK